jgi:predicted Zn-dependent protease
MSSEVERYDEAIQLQENGQLDQAVAKLEQLVADHPDYALAHAALSVFYQKLDRSDEAVEHAGKVCDLEPEDPFSFVAMSTICQKAGRIAEAEQALARAHQAQMASHRAEKDRD